jgi:hypothetical protein
MCSLEEAYTPFSDPPVVAERKQKKKKRYVLPPPEGSQETFASSDPDRPAFRRKVPGELLGEGFQDAPASPMLSAAPPAPTPSYFPTPSPDSKDPSVYNLDPQWAQMFTDSSAPSWMKDRMPDREAEIPLIPSAWVDGQSTLWENVNPGSVLNVRGAQSLADQRVDALQRKLDSLFARLEDIDAQKTKGAHLELIMFVFGGFFMLLLLDLVVKQGMAATIALSNNSFNNSMAVPLRASK